MKKIISFITVMLFVLISFAYASASVFYGDNNGDGNITVEDARNALRIAILLDEPGEESSVFIASDVDRDGSVTVGDARIILRCAIGLEDIEQPETPEYTVFDFNDAVNTLKGGQETRFSMLESTFVQAGEYTTGGMMGGQLKRELEQDLNELRSGAAEYSMKAQSRYLTDANFFVRGESFVSALTDGDVTEISVSQVSGIDFGDDFTAAKTAAGGAFPEAPAGTFDRVRVTLREASAGGADSPAARIFGNAAADTVNRVLSLTEGIDDLPGGVDSSASVTVGGEIVYWFDEASGKPAAAEYKLTVGVTFSVDSVLIRMNLPIDTVTTDYIVFV